MLGTYIHKDKKRIVLLVIYLFFSLSLHRGVGYLIFIVICAPMHPWIGSFPLFEIFILVIIG